MRICDKRISIIYKTILCIIGVFSLIAVTGVVDGSINLNVFGMFTILSNLLCVIYFTSDIIYLIHNYKNKYLVEWFPLLKGMTMMAITLTFVVAHFVLKLSFSFDTFKNASLLGLHYIVPIMTIFDWILFDKKGFIKKKNPIIWTILPIIYLTVAYICAFFGNGIGDNPNSKYPYSFMDIDSLGLNKVFINILIISVSYILIGYIYYLVDRILVRKRKKS